MPADLSIVIPTYNERDNIQPMVEALEFVLQGVSWEVVFVDDDSPDGTAIAAREIAIARPHVRCIQRIQRRGLSSACLEGILSTSSPYLAVMDCDMQHDEALLPEMLKKLQNGGVDLVIGSRYSDGGSLGDLDRNRAFISRLATRLGNIVLGINVRDPMSGYFMMSRQYFDDSMRRVSGIGFKLLLDLIGSGKKSPRIVELPYRMRRRRHGRSKLDAIVVVEYLYLLINKVFGRLVPNRFMMFSIVGATGVFVHLGTLALLHKVFGQEFALAQLTGTIVAMTSNYILNNQFTYYDRKLVGFRFVVGLFYFYLACSLGALINLLVSDHLHSHGLIWWGAGLAGAVIGAVWNYMMSSVLAWRDKAVD
jgi:dolichol-phosphate mannosyltransferase